MELIQGETLDDVLTAKKRLGVEQFLAFFDQFTSALAYIHSKQVLHRDIKPLNVMYDSNGTLKVMDFGIARDMASDETTMSIAVGTPPYMPPGYLEGGPLTSPSAIYSARILFHQLLTAAR